ncbi:MAG: hypothetical protein IJS80_05150 [Lachnospiraceae bacterium]|nr:hypothetical protein [Lachnospiraceae bacterium]
MSDPQDTKKNSGLYEESRVYGTRKQKEKRNASDKPAREKDGYQSKSTTVFAIIAMAVFMLAITVGIAGFFKKPEKKPDRTDASKTLQQTETEPIREFFGVVLNVDKAGMKISLYDVVKNEDTEVNYDGSTKFYGHEGSLITAGVLKVGDLMYFTCKERDRETLEKAEWSKEIWEKSKIDDLMIYPEENRMVIRDQNYRYSDELCILSDGQRCKLNDLFTTADRYTIRGKGTDVYEILVTIGHGTQCLMNFDDYSGGLLKVGERYAFDIVYPANYVVREGTYKVEASNGRLEAGQTIEIGRNRTVIFDLVPDGSRKTPTPTPTPKPVATATLIPTPTGFPKDMIFNRLFISRLQNKAYDVSTDHSMYVYGPAGGEIFIDGEYLGMIPCDTEKVLGTMEINVKYKGVSKTFKYNGADHSGDVLLDYTSAFE